MSIKPCPACKSDESHLGWAFDGSEQQRVCCSCDMAGPSASCAADADAAWNAMPRRGDGLAWRSEPPDKPGWWWKRLRSPSGAIDGPWIVNVSDIRCEASFLGELGADYEWAGPIPEPPAPDAEKEA